MTTRLMPFMLVAAVIACASGCAKPDWIQQTLVMVDVTGTWGGSLDPRGGATNFDVRLELQQRGAKVIGKVELLGAGTSGAWTIPSGPLDGTVAGDVFRFAQTNGSLTGEMTVNGDEMTGFLQTPTPRSMTLRRVTTTSQP